MRLILVLPSGSKPAITREAGRAIIGLLDISESAGVCGTRDFDTS
jgi:hypothetical protein